MKIPQKAKRVTKERKKVFIIGDSNKNSNIQGNTMLVEKDKLLSKQKDVASDFNKHLGSITDSLNLFSFLEYTSVSSGNNTINSVIKKFVFTPSINAIKKKNQN